MIAQFVLGVWDGVLEGFGSDSTDDHLRPTEVVVLQKRLSQRTAQNFTITRKWLHIIIVSEFAAFFGYKSLGNVLNRDSDKVRSARVIWSAQMRSQRCCKTSHQMG